MHLIMFDIDGTLVDTVDFEDKCYSKAVTEVISHSIDTDWSHYANATDSGILDEIIVANNLNVEKNSIFRDVKQLFISYIQKHIQEKGVNEIVGATSFMQLLKKRTDVTLAIATGGWEETAKIKLESAGIDYSNIAFASGSDCKSRKGIMKIAEERCPTNNFISKSYFGDAEWDKKASHDLNYNFILVGNRLNNSKQIDNYESVDEILSLVGL